MLRPPAPRGSSSDDQWVKCPSCDAFVYWNRFERNLRVCPECSYHFRLPARERLQQLLDPGSFQDLSAAVESVDVLGFVDSRPYPARLDEARRKTGNHEAVLYGPATIGRKPLVVAALDFPF